MASGIRTPDPNERRGGDHGGMLRRIEEKLDRLLGAHDDDWHAREWAPPDSPFAPYGPGGPRPSFIQGPADAPGWDPTFAGSRFESHDAGGVGVDSEPSSGAPDGLPVAARSSAREYYLLRQAKEHGAAREGDTGYADYRRRKSAELDREYAHYCCDRQECFDNDFSAWRQKRAGPAVSMDESASQKRAGKHEPAQLPPDRTRRDTD